IVQPADPAAPVTREEIVAYAKSRLTPYKVPKTVEFVDRMPRSEATKVNRATLVAERDDPAQGSDGAGGAPSSPNATLST
ncbi:MAG TPA: hypothetical protein VKQ71_16915, partial [Acidimicrobiales bacterium]|nr:hypothetical protein [Acidimicrobiales bacterium]